MGGRLSPAFIAVLAGVVLAIALFVPYVARQYRRRGELGLGHAMLSFAGLLYCLGLLAYVTLPVPRLTVDFCARHGVREPQLRPLRFLADVRGEATGAGVGALLHNPALTQVLMNIALFVPLGMFVRYLFRRGVLVTTLIGFAASLFIEVTQLTGNWSLFPCPYRLFDVDDLLANTLGALSGALTAPLLRLVPGQRSVTVPPGVPRRVSAGRRLLGMVCDFVLLNLLGVLFGALFRIALATVHGRFDGEWEGLDTLPGFPVGAPLVGTWLPWLLVFVVVPLAGNGTSPGQRVVMLDALTADGARPAAGRRLARSMAGMGGYVLLSGISDLTGPPLLEPAASALAGGLAVLSIIGVWTTREHRGLSYAVTGLHLADVRTSTTETRILAPVR
jgi:hypothetical protein